MTPGELTGREGALVAEVALLGELLDAAQRGELGAETVARHREQRIAALAEVGLTMTGEVAG